MITSPREWIETDALGGFALGNSTGLRDRRYHGILSVSDPSSLDRLMIVNGAEAYVECGGMPFALSSHKYSSGITHPDGLWRIESFTSNPWPTWDYKINEELVVRHELFMKRGCSSVFLSWSVVRRPSQDFFLTVRPLLSGRSCHALHRYNSTVGSGYESAEGSVIWKLYPGIPDLKAYSNGAYVHSPEWYYYFAYDEERSRGYDYIEDLFSPGLLRFNLSRERAVLIFSAGEEGFCPGREEEQKYLPDVFSEIESEQRRRRTQQCAPLELASEKYLVTRQDRQSIIAGYPWFSEWGRDTFIALRGLCLAMGRISEAEKILASWVSTLSKGMIPNRLPDRGKMPEYNSVDASLWYVVAVHEFLEAAKQANYSVRASVQDLLLESIDSIISAYISETRYSIKCEDDGLIAGGVAGQPLTWMDARIGDWSITPRIGKPVEVQALWINALEVARLRLNKWGAHCDLAKQSFLSRFWNDKRSCLYDVVDSNHRAGAVDETFRPNQIFAIGGLPFQVLFGEKALLVVQNVESRLLTPFGLRSLAPGETGYLPSYAGGQHERDKAYHQGTVWPWLLGAFIEAWLRVQADKVQAKKEAKERFLGSLAAHLESSGMGHISEIFDAEPPHTARGCPFQAWSLGEYLRIVNCVLA